MPIIFALSAGMLVILCISINGRLSKKVGLIQAGMTNYFVGLISSFIYIFLTNNIPLTELLHVDSGIPFYFFCGGAVGSLIMVLNSLIINNLSAVYVTILVFIGQLSTGVLIDYIQSSILPIGKILGGILIVVGLFFYIKGDNLKNAKIES